MAPLSTLTRKKKSGKKRKSPSSSGSGLEIAPLYQQDLGTAGIKKQRTNQVTMLANSFDLPMTKVEKKKRLKRKERFESEVECSPTAFPNDGPIPLYSSLSAPRTTTTGPKSKKSSHGRFVGENRNLEKPYLRLTDYPKKEAVRPLEVVIKSLAHIKSRYCQEEDFEWANEQLKSVRQDLTVQAIRNKFVLDVYETHARILLEHGDLNEFNQCQTVIRTLTQGSVGVEKDTTDSSEYFQGELAALCCEEDSDDKALRQSDISADEFRGYGFLYALVRNSWSDLKTELVRTRETLAAVVKDENHSHSDRTSNCMHALQVVTAVNANDYRNFFRLYDSAPYMSAYLMDFLVKRVRDSAFERIIAAYRPTVSVEHFRECLFFQDLDETRLFLQESGAVFVQEKGEPLFFVDCKASGTSGKKSDPRLY